MVATRLVGTMGPELVAAAFGMGLEATMMHLSGHVGAGRARDQQERRR